MPTLSNEELKKNIIHMLCDCDVEDSSYVTGTRFDYDMAADAVLKLFATQNTALLKELLSELPEKLDMQPAIKTHSDAGAGTVIGHNHLLSKVKDLINSKLAAMGEQ